MSYNVVLSPLVAVSNPPDRHEVGQLLTLEEKRQDALAEEQFADREQELDGRRRDVSHRVKRLNARARALRSELAAITNPDDERVLVLTGRLEDIEEDLAEIKESVYQLVADALAVVSEDGEPDYQYTAADVRSWCDRAEEMGYGRPILDATLIRDLTRMRQVPNAPFREAVESLLAQEEQTAGEFVERLWHHLRLLEEQDGKEYGSRHLMSVSQGRPTPQERQLERLLGIEGRTNGHGSSSLRLFIPYELGVALVRALGMSPIQAGL